MLGLSEWVSILADLVIVTVLIYRILLIIRGTQAVPMLVGLAAIIALYTLSAETRLNLPTFHWLLGQFIGSLLLIVVILFQSDLRRALAAMGRTQLFQMSARTGQDAQVIDELVKAMTALAQQKIGALVIIERDANLNIYMEESVRIDARLSKELLYSLFVPERQNPLHDGAVVVRQGRVEAAGVFLPMSVNPHLERHLGTRHRAALGISEETDAVVLVVSEERGSISLAVEGNLSEDLPLPKLREHLMDLFLKSAIRRSRRERVTHWKFFKRSKSAGAGGTQSLSITPIQKKEAPFEGEKEAEGRP